MPPRFVADSMVGRLARWLRAFGFDVVYHPFADDREVLAWARERAAILLTRDTGLRAAAATARRRGRVASLVRVIFIEHDNPEQQLQQVVQETPLDLTQARPLTRCTMCNTELVWASRDEVWDQVPPFIYLTHESFARCPGCRRVYWEGTHVGRMRARLARLAGPEGVLPEP
jgi:uncharacterized protein with PIN domain